MPTQESFDVEAMRSNAADAADFLRMLSNSQRLLVLCHLLEAGELAVGELVDRVGMSQSALSQHLAKLRTQGLVASRRDSQTRLYRIEDDRTSILLETLHELFCAESSAPNP